MYNSKDKEEDMNLKRDKEKVQKIRKKNSHHSRIITRRENKY